ncbi:MAG: phosphorylase [Deltaproteobacteria bacterium]|nr:phosphorylase [Deltaproteobacteria bacterium]
MAARLDWSLVVTRSAEAQSLGTQLPIQSDQYPLPDEGLPFVVRVARGLGRKPRPDPANAAALAGNPFLPPFEPGLFVQELTPTHRVLLNKFNVFPHHALVVSHDFEPQSRRLGLPDFDALHRCLDGVEGLAFYNATAVAGASQPHRHLQIIPLPVPLLPGTVQLPCRADLLPLPATPEGSLGAYREGLARLGRDHDGAGYNLLCTREWMLLVPRARESVGDVSLNALAFAGSFFVKTEAQREQLRATGPAAALRIATGG